MSNNTTTSLQNGLLTLDGASFTSNDLSLLQNKKSTNIKFNLLKSGVRFDVLDEDPTEFTYAVIQKSGKVDKSITLQQDDTGYFFNPTSDGILLSVTGIRLRNYGNQASNKWANPPSFSVSVPEVTSDITETPVNITFTPSVKSVTPDMTELATLPSFSVGVKGVESDMAESSNIPSFNIGVKEVTTDITELNTAPSFTVNVMEVDPDKKELNTNITFSYEEL